MGVYLREKKLGNGQVSFYLDIYNNKRRWYEFLEIRVNKRKPTEQDKEKKKLAQEIRSKRENELIVQENSLVDKSKRKADFIKWYEKFLSEKNPNPIYSGVLYHLRNYSAEKVVSFSAISPQWCMDFVKYLKTKVRHNTARKYALTVFTGLEEAERKGIIPKNPFRLIEKKDRIKQQDTTRNSYSLEQLQLLSETPCKIEMQYKQAFLFSCFSGLRWSDVNPLRWDEIIIKEIDGQLEYFLYFEQEKTEGIEYLPMSDQAVEILKVRKAEMKEQEYFSPYVFPKVKETDEKNKLVYNRVRYALKKWAKAAGLNPKEMKFHVSRHTFATNILEHSPDADLWTVSKLLGHKSIDATQIYAHVRDKKKSLAVKSLPKLNTEENALKVA
jgi:integrase